MFSLFADLLVNYHHILGIILAARLLRTSIRRLQVQDVFDKVWSWTGRRFGVEMGMPSAFAAANLRFAIVECVAVLHNAGYTGSTRNYGVEMSRYLYIVWSLASRVVCSNDCLSALPFEVLCCMLTVARCGPLSGLRLGYGSICIE